MVDRFDSHVSSGNFIENVQKRVNVRKVADKLKQKKKQHESKHFNKTPTLNKLCEKPMRKMTIHEHVTTNSVSMNSRSS